MRLIRPLTSRRQKIMWDRIGAGRRSIENISRARRVPMINQFLLKAPIAAGRSARPGEEKVPHPGYFARRLRKQEDPRGHGVLRRLVRHSAVQGGGGGTRAGVHDTFPQLESSFPTNIAVSGARAWIVATLNAPCASMTHLTSIWGLARRDCAFAMRAQHGTRIRYSWTECSQCPLFHGLLRGHEVTPSQGVPNMS